MTAQDENRRQANARLIHRLIKQTPASKEDICSRLDISEREFDAAKKWSQTVVDPNMLANEIICVTSSAPYLYYLAKNADQADEYITRRAKLADSHLASVERLLVKELEKYPEKSREITLNLTAVRRMREDMVWLLAD